MEIELARLVNAARRISARITPTWDKDAGTALITAADVHAISLAVTRTEFSSVDGNQIKALIGAHLPPADRRIAPRDVLMLTAGISRLADSADRKRRLSLGQITGPLSGNEAVNWMMGRFGR
jgi:hypothetical protein